MLPFDLTPSKRSQDPPDDLSMEVLQGWEDIPQPDLMETCCRESMLDLMLIRNGTPSKVVFGIHGPSVTMGRYSPVTGPVDIDLGVLQDHERYRVGLPHARIYREGRSWWVEPMTWSYPTSIDGEPVSSSGIRLEDSSFLSLGSALFQIKLRGDQPDETADFSSAASLVLKRGGGVCNTQLQLKGESLVIGRSSPTTGPVDIDLTCLPDSERVYIARRHALLTRKGDTWSVSSLNPQGTVFVNRGSPIRDRHSLTHGEEVAFGNVIFQFAHTAGLLASGPLATAVLGPRKGNKGGDS